MGREKAEFAKIIRFMPKGWDKKAKELGALVRARRVKSAEDLLRLNILYLTEGKSFGGTSALLGMGEDLKLNKVAVWKRVKHSAEWLRWLDENIYRRAGILAAKPGWLCGKEVCLVDGTLEGVKGKKKGAYKLHYSIDLFTLGMKEMLLTDMQEGEKLEHFKGFKKGEIVLGDRIYGTIPGMEHVRGSGADFILRLRAGAFSVYNARGKKINIINRLRGLKRGEAREIKAYYKAGEVYKPVRICALRKEKSSEEAGLRRIKKSNQRKLKGREISLRQSEYNKYVIVASSLEESISAEQALSVYRMRWQIELVFKRLKSLFHYNEVPSALDESARAWFYGKLLLAALCETVVNRGRFSPRRRADRGDAPVKPLA